MSGIICPYCHETQLRVGLPAGQRVRCEMCQRWFVAIAEQSAADDLELEDSAATGEQLLAEVRKVLNTIPHIDKYQIGKEIASGGMGRILTARDPYIRRELVVKILGDKQSDEEKARFLEEAQVTGQLEHPNIVPVHDLGLTNDGRLFFLMKRVRGKSLEEILDLLRIGDSITRMAFTLPRLLQILESVCNAVAYAHARGVIHRDLKPANIMLGDFGEVLVMDWGLAKVGNVQYRPTSQHFPISSGSGRTAALANDYHETMRATVEIDKYLPDVDLSQAISIMRSDVNIWGTRSGTIAGTPAYMSPEQARGDLDLIDERSDIYSMGGILYEILTGLPPVLASTETEIVNNVIDGNILPPPVRTPNRKIPDELSRIAMKALATAPANRYQSALDFQSDLRAFLDGITVYRHEDSFWQTAYRLFQHYKLASFLSGLAFVVVIAGSIYFFVDQRVRIDTTQQVLIATQARLETERTKKENDRLRAPLEYNVANIYLDQNKLAEARRHLELAINYDPEFRPARLKNAELYLLEQNYRAALEQVRVLLSANSSDPDAIRISEQARRGMLEINSVEEIPFPEAD